MCRWDLLKGEVTEVAGNVPDIPVLVKTFRPGTVRYSIAIRNFHPEIGTICGDVDSSPVICADFVPFGRPGDRFAAVAKPVAQVNHICSKQLDFLLLETCFS
jgi:hypothetical protein